MIPRAKVFVIVQIMSCPFRLMIPLHNAIACNPEPVNYTLPS